MTTALTPPVAPRAMDRRGFLRLAVAAGGASWLAAGCAPYGEAGVGLAFSPWEFPGDERRPEFLAVRAAILAANPHNTQPWRFRVTADVIDVFVDESRALGAMDPLGRERHLGVGCAIENAALAAGANGREARVAWLPTAGDPTHVARIALAAAAPRASALYDAIPARRMNKFAYADLPVPPAVLAALAAAVDDSRVTLAVHTDATTRARLRQVNLDAVTAITQDREMAEASHRWWRQGDAEVQRTRDGLNLDGLGLDGLTRSLAGTVATVTVEEANSYWVDAIRTRHGTASGFFTLATRDRDDREQQLVAGRIFQRAALTLHALGVDLHPLNMLPEMQDREQTTAAARRPFTEECARWVPAGHGLQMLSRFGYAFERAAHTPRRALEAVLA